MNKKAFITSWYIDFWAYLITFILLTLFFLIFIPMAREQQTEPIQKDKILLDTGLLTLYAYKLPRESLDSFTPAPQPALTPSFPNCIPYIITTKDKHQPLSNPLEEEYVTNPVYKEWVGFFREPTYNTKYDNSFIFSVRCA